MESPTPDDWSDPSVLESLIDHAQDKLVVVGDDGTYLYANDAAGRILGYSPEALVGTGVFGYVHPEDRARVQAVFEGLVEADEQRTETVEYRHRTDDDGWTWLESRMSNRLVADLGGYVVSSRDITGRKHAEEQRRETESRLRQLAANTNDVLWIFSADWSETLFVNEAVEDVYGVGAGALTVRPGAFLEAIHPEDRPAVQEAMATLSAGESVDIEYRVNPESGYRRWVWVKGQPLFEDGEVTRIVGFSRDVTDRRRQERHLRVMDNLLRHNLRNDMNVILGHADSHRDHADADVAASMDRIVETGERLLRTAEKEREIVDVLVDCGPPERLDVADIARGVVERFEAGHPEAAVSLEAEAAAAAVAVPTVRRGLQELLENAAEHAEADPEIRVTVRTDDEEVVVVVEDNAPPIPDEEVVPLFEAEEFSALYHGTGLGLWLVYWIIDRSGGDLSFERSETGNTVTVRLPRADLGVEAEDENDGDDADANAEPGTEAEPQ